MERYKYILFDFDGTVADSKPVVLSVYNELAARRGYTKIEAYNIDKLRSLSIKSRCRELNVPLYKIPFIAAYVIKQYGKSLHQLTFNPGVEDLLGNLTKEGISYAILSTNAVRNISGFFQLQNLSCPEIYTSSKVFGKHRLMKKFLKQKKFQPNEVLYVGDELRDIIACRKCGIPVAWAAWGYDAPEALTANPPDYVLNNPEDLLQII
ncbi:HAD hydrolase-like protein [Flavobacterium sp.]|uniref:HAD hydrolase-like protein n=1 Tax=Flavobacterium sp. TaxID=239 RepID=UPI00261703AF|nr:HAD hydrolase-like protein [Flavobacterium sp.]